MTAAAPLALTTLPAAFQQSNVDYLAILPMLIVFATSTPTRRSRRGRAAT